MFSNSFNVGFFLALSLFTSGPNEIVSYLEDKFKSEWILKSVNCKDRGWWTYSPNPIPRNTVEIPAKMFPSETSTSKITLPCQLWMVAFVKCFPEMSKIHSIERCSRNAEPQKPARSVGGRYTLPYKSLFPGTKDTSSDSTCDSVIPSCVGEDHMNPKGEPGATEH